MIIRLLLFLFLYFCPTFSALVTGQKRSFIGLTSQKLLCKLSRLKAHATRWKRSFTGLTSQKLLRKLSRLSAFATRGKRSFLGFFSQKLLAHLFKSCKVGFQQLYLLDWVYWWGWCLATPYQSGRKVSFVQLYASA